MADAATPAAMEIAGVALKGAGATFPANLYKKWFEEFQVANPGTTVAYQATAAARVFGTSSKARSTSGQRRGDDRRRDRPGSDGVVMVPLAAGAVALAYNVPDAPEGLRLSRDVYAGIFLGEIQKLERPENRRMQPRHDPAGPAITVVLTGRVERNDVCVHAASVAVSQAWDEGPGTGTTVEWPVGVPAKRNADIADRIRQTPGAIGYLEYGYAKDARLTWRRWKIARVSTLPGVGARAGGLGRSRAAGELARVCFRPAGPQSLPGGQLNVVVVLPEVRGSEGRRRLAQLIRHCLTRGQESRRGIGIRAAAGRCRGNGAEGRESRVGVADEK